MKISYNLFKRIINSTDVIMENPEFTMESINFPSGFKVNLNIHNDRFLKYTRRLEMKNVSL